ncbi:LysR family transcriptional regulator [Actinoplanes sp. N902-109]|uniref:LysR family transcriptional regulator n=1 Tax=Actinoplanes sp. (strain N902-109) TaxID=649831 RepID=UPI001E396E42|nr:LysR family transcriptional regulator [Actinoplanes sp. N902-109]
MPLPPGADLDLRLVGYFTVVAEHLNFGRAAAELRLAQPHLSRQIQRLESRLGVRLLDRTPQGSRLTPAGEAFLPEAQALLKLAGAATQAARDAEAPPLLTVGYVEGLVVTAAVRDLRRDRPGARVVTRYLAWNETDALLDRRVDVLVTRLPLPFPTETLKTTLLYEEPWVLVVPLSHPLAGRDVVTPADYAAERPAACTGAAGAFAAAEQPFPQAFPDKLQLVADGTAIAVRPAGDRRSTLREDLASIPIEGLPPCPVVVVSRPADPNPLVERFRTAAHASVAAAVAG